MQENNLIDNRVHYKSFGFESIDLIICVIELMPIKNMGFHVGNTIKYVLRSKFKSNEIQDLKKANWYITKSKKWIQNKESIITEQSEVLKYLDFVSKKDFKLYIVLNGICSFALNPSIRNYEILEKIFASYMNERCSPNV
ncbi:TPA: DUF3310 domain-containing protein [Campylobacter jejuni]|nr:DUF3310 domain-containing protein [Campylobacter jejuni]